MDTGDDEELERLIVEREQLLSSGDPRITDYDTRIAALAAQRHFLPEELNDITAQVLAERRRPDGRFGSNALLGEYRISEPERFLPFYIGALLAAIIAAMGQPFVAAIFVALLVMVHLLLPKKIRDFTVDESGNLYLGTRPSVPLDFRSVARVEVKLHAPRWGTEIVRAARARLAIRIEMLDGQCHRFARGMFFQKAQGRRPIHHVHVERFLRASVERAGLSVTRTDGGFLATRA